jgi:hypothetical protein
MAHETSYILRQEQNAEKMRLKEKNASEEISGKKFAKFESA